jgi:hypothetical protein
LFILKFQQVKQMAIKERLKAFRSLRGGKSEDVQEPDDTDNVPPIEAFSNHVSELKGLNYALSCKCSFQNVLPATNKVGRAKPKMRISY